MRVSSYPGLGGRRTLEVATGKVIGSLHRRHRAVEFKKFLTKLDEEVPADLEVHLILDNYVTHKTPAVKKWLLAHPRFRLHFTPASSSWLNLVERWFAELTQKKLKPGVHRSVQALERDIRSWLADWNEHPRPFAWTKTADEIFDKVAAYETLAHLPAGPSIVVLALEHASKALLAAVIARTARPRHPARPGHHPRREGSRRRRWRNRSTRQRRRSCPEHSDQVLNAAGEDTAALLSNR